MGCHWLTDCLPAWHCVVLCFVLSLIIEYKNHVQRTSAARTTGKKNETTSISVVFSCIYATIKINSVTLCTRYHIRDSNRRLRCALSCRIFISFRSVSIQMVTPHTKTMFWHSRVIRVSLFCLTTASLTRTNRFFFLFRTQSTLLFRYIDDVWSGSVVLLSSVLFNQWSPQWSGSRPVVHRSGVFSQNILLSFSICFFFLLSALRWMEARQDEIGTNVIVTTMSLLLNFFFIRSISPPSHSFDDCQWLSCWCYCTDTHTHRVSSSSSPPMWYVLRGFSVMFVICGSDNGNGDGAKWCHCPRHNVRNDRSRVVALRSLAFHRRTQCEHIVCQRLNPCCYCYVVCVCLCVPSIYVCLR